MRKVTLAGLALALVFTVSGCGDSPESITKDMIKAMNEMADVLESIKDKDSAEKAKPKLEALSKKMKDLKERADKLKVDDKKKKELEEKYKDEVAKAGMRLFGALAKVGSNPDAAAALKSLDLKGFGK